MKGEFLNLPALAACGSMLVGLEVSCSIETGSRVIQSIGTEQDKTQQKDLLWGLNWFHYIFRSA
jgi:hypothetical protein